MIVLKLSMKVLLFSQSSSMSGLERQRGLLLGRNFYYRDKNEHTKEVIYNQCKEDNTSYRQLLKSVPGIPGPDLCIL